MAVTSKVYGQALRSVLTGQVNLDTATVKVMLCTEAYQPDLDAHRFKAAVTDEVAGTGYVAGGQVVAGKVLAYDAVANTLRLRCDDPSWPGSTITARYAVWYVDTGSAATSPLLVLWDLGEDVVSANGSFDLQVGAAGLLTAQAV